ncbi:macrophage erythroblast attacher [Geosmithia morbida]|uniref:Macrophage erythroblast attacher n=1 Tax=Geosmithia morbida TaxID=1094350 RepID=A0A9P5D0W5_9HYPO|nr:macrophage erythroblast attacher [Geosmithia morbida]KAF4123183.1 macrophage erythroblast attacher [Geosmithia morbida]
MADHELSAIRHSEHVLLPGPGADHEDLRPPQEQPLLRLPNELLRKNFRSAHFAIEKDTTALKTLLRETSGLAPLSQVLRSLDAMLVRMRGVKRKLVLYAEEESRLHDQAEARVAHLDRLYSHRSVDDVGYESWNRLRLDRLLTDYMLRKGYYASARQLASERSMEPLVDADTFERMGRIVDDLRAGSVAKALAWCADNKKELRKMDSDLEFTLRLQQFIELVRRSSLAEAMAHARKHLVPHRLHHPRQVQRACGLLAVPPGTPAASLYEDLYRPRWRDLADSFTRTHNALLSLPDTPLLHIALSSGLSALKTPACHAPCTDHPPAGTPSASVSAGVDASSSSSSSPSSRGICPICSVELNDLAAHVPYAHHTKSHVLSDLVLLPSGRTRSRQLLIDEATKAGVAHGWVKDSANGSLVRLDELKKVYIT